MLLFSRVDYPKEPLKIMDIILCDLHKIVNFIAPKGAGLNVFPWKM